ncbi:Chloride channel protein [Mycena indigotica]|uniref:Chloride channel protein n=1 Tax=Mycena indigotica TaxID=2126181 RepID=A0A8H6WI88_9AGAR|nr:Chloride channel protein [Mycena indigotica]KAF7315858.1 Chloride channel protein [Mycena indigotica]
MPPSLTRVAIVGGGIGGLTLARILQLRQSASLTFSLFEAEANASLRATLGGSLDLKRESGQRALHDAALHAQFLKLCRPAGGALKIFDDTARIYYEDKGSDKDMYNPEIDRGQLRSMILDSLRPGTVQWGHKAVAAKRDHVTGKYSVQFTSGKSEGGFDIVVGADGAWSSIRPLVWPGVLPTYSGVTFLDTKIDIKSHPALSQLVGEGSIIAMGGGKCIMAQMSSNNVLTVYSAIRVPENWARTSDVALAETPEEKIRLMLAHFASWDESLRQFIRVSKNPVIRPIYALPHDSKPRAQTDNVVLLGDAAHLMSPFAGAGVNMAMVDAADLANVLVEGQPLETYEAIMRERGNEAGQESADNLDTFFGEGAATKLTALFRTFDPA